MACASFVARCLRSFRRSGIAFQVAVWMSLTSILPLAIVGYLAHRAAVGSLRTMMLTDLSSVVESRTNRLDAYLQERREDIAVLARSPAILSAMERFELHARAGEPLRQGSRKRTGGSGIT